MRAPSNTSATQTKAESTLLTPRFNVKAKIEWEKPRGLKVIISDDGSRPSTGVDLDRSVLPVTSFKGGTGEGVQSLPARICRSQAGGLSVSGMANQSSIGIPAGYAVRTSGISGRRLLWSAQLASVMRAPKR